MADDKKSLLAERQHNPVREGLAETGLYHSIELPDGRVLAGAMPLSYQQERLRSFLLPESLEGKQVLDIGPWDGWFTFELEKRGAKVTCIDYADLDTFRALHKVFESKAEYLTMDLYDLDPNKLGPFDVVLCLGVLYHLKHPLLALEKICGVTREVCIIDTYVTDGVLYQQGDASPIPSIEFYERGELAGQLDNWCGPTVSAVEALARTAGFATTQILAVTSTSVRVAAHRKWQTLPPEVAPAPVIRVVSSHRNRGKSFVSKDEEYLEVWCDWDDSREVPAIDCVFPEVDAFGVSPLSCVRSGPSLMISFRLPPGLAAGSHFVRMKVEDSIWSEPSVFHVDLAPVSNPVELLSIQDGVSWQGGVVDWASGGWVTVWMSGLSPEADAGNVSVSISGIPHPVTAVAAGGGQVNFRLRPFIAPGTHTVQILHRGVESRPLDFEVQGEPPRIRGLELLGEIPPRPPQPR
jgi:tRNA (mo5U34)-methyltransferase